MFPFYNTENIPNIRVDDSLKFCVQFFRQVTNDEITVIYEGEQQRLNEVFTQSESCAFPLKKCNLYKSE